jgi:hypothetical protein
MIMKGGFSWLTYPVLLTLGAWLGGCSGYWTHEPEQGFRASADAAFLYGPIRGFVQTPAGGHPGTTSDDRPTLKELGIETAPMADASVTAGWGAHDFYGGARVIELSGTSTLSQTLLTHNVTFPAGTAVSSDVQLNWYRIGYAHRWLLRHDDATLRLEPAIEAVIFDFDYAIAGGGQSTSRTYLKGNVRLGVRTVWSPRARFSLSGAVLESVPIPGQPMILTAQASGGYRLWGTAAGGGVVSLGIGYDLLDHRDLQTVPNHIHAEIGPQLLASLAVNF